MQRKMDGWMVVSQPVQESGVPAAALSAPRGEGDWRNRVWPSSHSRRTTGGWGPPTQGALVRQELWEARLTPQTAEF